MIAKKREVAVSRKAKQVFRGANVKFIKLATSHCIPSTVRHMRRKRRVNARPSGRYFIR